MLEEILQKGEEASICSQAQRRSCKCDTRRWGTSGLTAPQTAAGPRTARAPWFYPGPALSFSDGHFQKTATAISGFAVTIGTGKIKSAHID